MSYSCPENLVKFQSFVENSQVPPSPGQMSTVWRRPSPSPSPSVGRINFRASASPPYAALSPPPPSDWSVRSDASAAGRSMSSTGGGPGPGSKEAIEREIRKRMMKADRRIQQLTRETMELRTQQLISTGQISDDEAQDLVNTAEHILRSQDALHAAAERLAKDNTELREYVRLLLPVALKEEARDAQAEAAKVRHGQEDDVEKESLMLEYEMALGECKELNKKLEARERKMSRIAREQATAEKALVASERQRVIYERKVAQLEDELERCRLEASEAKATIEASSTKRTHSSAKPPAVSEAKLEEEVMIRERAERERDALREQVNEALSLLERQAELSRSTPALPMDDKSELATLRLGAAAASRCRAENAELVERVRLLEGRLREAASAQSLLLETVEDRRGKVEALTTRCTGLERELGDARTQGRCVIDAERALEAKCASLEKEVARLRALCEHRGVVCGEQGGAMAAMREAGEGWRAKCEAAEAGFAAASARCGQLERAMANLREKAGAYAPGLIRQIDASEMNPGNMGVMGEGTMVGGGVTTPGSAKGGSGRAGWSSGKKWDVSASSGRQMWRGVGPYKKPSP